MVEPDAKSPRSDRDEAAMDAARHAAGGEAFSLPEALSGGGHVV